MKKIILAVSAGILVLALGFVLGARLIGGEDNWICDGNQWVRHGQPSAPAPTTGCGAETKEPIPQNETMLDSPQPNEAMASPYKVTGSMPGSWYFEATALVKLLDANGKGLGSAPAQAKGGWMTDKMVPFEATLQFDVPTTPTGILILQADNPSGLPENDKQERYTVQFLPTVKVFFNNDKFDPNLMDCSKVYPVNRSIKPTLAVARAALEELFKGPTADERKLGYLTNIINSGVKIQKLTIVGGVAKVDFSAELERAVGGSCKTTAIRSQITETLKQFPTVNSVVISIDGRTEDILQP